MNSITRKWIEVGKLLAKDKTILLRCPECGIGTLAVIDEIVPDYDDKIDRYLICSYCNNWNVVTIQLYKEE